MFPVSNFPFTDLLSPNVLLGYKILLFVIIEAEPNLNPPIAIVLIPIEMVQNKIFVIILTMVKIIVFFSLIVLRDSTLHLIPKRFWVQLQCRQFIWVCRIGCRVRLTLTSRDFYHALQLSFSRRVPLDLHKKIGEILF